MITPEIIILSFIFSHFLKDSPRKDYYKINNFLSEDEKVLRDLDDKWKAIPHEGIIKDKTYTFYWGEVRTPLLTNKRLIIIKDGTVESEIPTNDMKKADDRLAGGVFSLFPYLRIELKNGRYFSLAFVFTGRAIKKKYPSEKKGEYYQYSGWRLSVATDDIIRKWSQSINNLVEETDNEIGTSVTG
jgi:hypothetical protein